MLSYFNEEEILQRLVFYPDWSLEEGFLVKHYAFKNFTQAFGFVTQVALISERLNHHPSIHLEYNRLKLSIMTHDVGGITSKDFQWIEKVNQIPLSSLE